MAGWILNNDEGGHVLVEVKDTPSPGIFSVEIHVTYLREAHLKYYPPKLSVLAHALPTYALRIRSTSPRTQPFEPDSTAWEFAVTNLNDVMDEKEEAEKEKKADKEKEKDKKEKEKKRRQREEGGRWHIRYTERKLNRKTDRSRSKTCVLKVDYDVVSFPFVFCINISEMRRPSSFISSVSDFLYGPLWRNFQSIVLQIGKTKDDEEEEKGEKLVTE